MATPRTRKKHSFDTGKVAQKLDHMLDTVVQRGIYVVKKLSHQHYAVIEVKTQRVMVDHIPFKRFALSVCDNLNRRQRKPSAEYLREVCWKFQRLTKLINDCACYRHTLEHYSDKTRQIAVTARLHQTRATIDQIQRALSGVCIFDAQDR